MGRTVCLMQVWLVGNWSKTVWQGEFFLRSLLLPILLQCQIQSWPCTGAAANQYCMWCLPSGGLIHFWDTARQSIISCANDSWRHTELHCRCASLVVYSATNPSLPPSVAQISAIDVDSKDFREIICKQEEAQVITAKLSHFDYQGSECLCAVVKSTQCTYRQL